MHISEGILPAPHAAAWFVASAPFIYAGLRKVKTVSREVPSFKALVGIMGAAVFVISALPIPVPFTGTCSHPAGTGMAAILVGPFVSTLLSTIALLIHSLFMAHGGITTLGANIFSMGVMGSFAGYAAFRGLRAVNAPFWLAAFAAGLASDWATYTGTSLIMALGLHGNGSLWGLFGAIMLAFVPTQLPLGILEGIITAGMAGYILKHRPDILLQLKVIP
ncbi:MAG: energy-coupling factor ABC transporter permease, partial [Nitrospirota bacterium]|nr:energy-coupling factor ABC transporter permease [Nitrospirota bacterium]